MSKRILPCLGALAVLFPQGAMAHHVTLGSSAEHAGPITTVSPETLSKGQWAAGVRTQVFNFNSFSDEFLEDTALAGIEEVHYTDSIIAPSLGLSYGVSDRLEISLKIPYFVHNGIREGEFDGVEAEVEILGDSAGIGDLVAFGKYRLLNGESGLGAALLLGLQMPTGKTSEQEDEGGSFETEFQPGTGAWSPIAGIALGRNLGAVSLDTSVLYTFAGNGSQDTNLGDNFAFNAALSYRLGSGEHDDGGDAHGHASWDLMVELNGEWQERERIGDESDIHSGGTQIFVSPGIRYNSAQNWGAFLSLGLPIHEDLNGVQNDTDFRLSAGIGFTF